MDAIWGIGLGVREALERDPSSWPGLNLLGKALMVVRDEMLPRSSASSESPHGKSTCGYKRLGAAACGRGFACQR